MNEKVLIGTTPTIKWHINSNVDLSLLKEAQIVVRQTLKHSTTMKEFLFSDGRVLINSENKMVWVTLTQEETLEFNNGLIDIQLRMLFQNGLAVATRVFTTRTGDLLKGGVLS